MLSSMILNTNSSSKNKLKVSSHYTKNIYRNKNNCMAKRNDSHTQLQSPPTLHPKPSKQRNQTQIILHICSKKHFCRTTAASAYILVLVFQSTLYFHPPWNFCFLPKHILFKSNFECLH